MSIRVLVLSPLHNMGVTACTALLAQGVTYAGKSSLITFTDVESPLPGYLGVEGIEDPTRSITQVVELIDNSAIQNKEIINYAHMYAKNAYLMNTANKTLNNTLRSQTVRYIYERVTADVVFCDCSEEVETSLVSELLELTDIILLVVRPIPKAVKYVRNWLEMSILKDNPNVLVMLNEYDETICSIRSMAKDIYLPANRLCKLHYNPWITKCCFSGTLPTIIPLTMQYDERVVNLMSDLSEFAGAVASAAVIQNKRG